MQRSSTMTRVVYSVLLSASVALLGSHMMAPTVACAQDVASNPGARQCGDYVESYKAGPEEYGPYLKFTDDVAKSRDKHESSKRYITALQGSSAPSNALWLNNWCSKNPLKVFAQASNGLLDELTGQAAKPATTPASGQQPQVVVVPTAPAAPSSCRVGATKYCAGCSVSCTDGTKARCMAGVDKFYDNSCLQDAVCRCK